MIALLIFLLRLLALISKPKRGLEAEMPRSDGTNSDRQEGPDFDRRNENSASLRPDVLHQLSLLSHALGSAGPRNKRKHPDHAITTSSLRKNRRIEALSGLTG